MADEEVLRSQRGVADDEVLAAASALRALSPGAGVVLGGGFCGLACAYELACRGIGVVVVDGAAPGEAPASSAAAGMLDPLTVKGRLMWQGDTALAAALELIRTADPDACVEGGILHVPHSAKHGEQLRRAADAHALAGEAAAGGVLAGCRWLCAEKAEAVAPGICMPLGALLCPRGCVVDAPAYLRALWSLVQNEAARRGVGARWVVHSGPRRTRWVGRWASRVKAAARWCHGLLHPAAWDARLRASRRYALRRSTSAAQTLVAACVTAVNAC